MSEAKRVIQLQLKFWPTLAVERPIAREKKPIVRCIHNKGGREREIESRLLEEEMCEHGEIYE